jgi:hypothetical protein
MRWLVVLGAWLVVGCGAAAQRAPTSSREASSELTPPTNAVTPSPSAAGSPETRAIVLPITTHPAHRTDAPVFVAVPSLAAGDDWYGEAMGIDLAGSTSGSAQFYLRSLREVVEQRATAIRTASYAYANAAHTPEERALASVRMGDLWDAWAHAIESVTTPRIGAFGGRRLPRGDDDDDSDHDGDDLAGELMTAERMFQREYGGQPRVGYCRAVDAYRAALAIDPNEPRALAQVMAYGEAFAATCDAFEPDGR